MMKVVTLYKRRKVGSFLNLLEGAPVTGHA
jgi:hypothetical protein